MTATTLDLIPTTQEPTDDELMARLNAGDVESSLEILMRRYRRRIHRLVNGIVRDCHMADDVTQEVFATVFLKGHQYQPGSSFRAWLHWIARNRALSTLRSQRNTPKPAANLEAFSPRAEAGRDPLESFHAKRQNCGPEEQELMAAFDDAVNELPDHYRTVFREAVVNGRSYRDVAEEFAIPTGTVAIRIMRARRRLYATLSRHMGRIRRPPACLQ